MTELWNAQVGGILQEIGGFGIYQKFLCLVIVGAINGICALTFAAQLFSLVTPDHWCWDPKLASLEEQLPLDQEEGKKFSLPVVATGLLPWTESQQTSFSQCKRYDGDLVGAYIGWMAARRPPHMVPKTPVHSIPYPVKDCTEGWAYNHTFSTLITDNDWVCNSQWKKYAIHTAFWFGVAVGGFTCRHLANRFGKRTAIIAGMLMYFLGGIIILITSELIPLFISRFTSGMGHFSSCYMSLLLVIELCAEKYRIIPVVVMMLAHITGTLAAPWIAHAVASWWGFTLITTILSAVLCLMLLWVTPESPWWLMMNDRNEDANILLRKIASINKKKNVNLKHKAFEDSSDSKCSDNGKRQNLLNNSRHDLLACENNGLPEHGGRKIITNTIWILCGLCYYGNYYTCASLVATALNRRSSPSDVFLSFWYAALMEIPTWMLPFILQGRPMLQKVILSLSLSTTATTGINYALLPTGHSELSLVLGLLNRFAITVAYYSAFQRWCENNVGGRVTATKFGSVLGMGALIIPCSLYAGQYYSRIPVLIFATLASLAALMSILLPAQTIEEDQTIDDSIFHRFGHWLRTKPIRRISVVPRYSLEGEAGCVTSTVPYDPL